MDPDPIKRGNLDTETDTQRENDEKDRGRAPGAGRGLQRCSCSPSNARWPVSPQKPERGRGWVSRKPPDELTLLTPQFQTSSPKNGETLSGLRYFVKVALESKKIP